jgi:NADPH-dependent F420 reductase
VCQSVAVHIGILGGTGPLGRGLAVRLAAAGTRVTLGSRDPERAETMAAELRDRWPELELPIDGAGNAAAAETELVVMATPWEAAVATVLEVQSALADKVVVSVANALVREGRDMLAVIPPRGSVAACVAAALPDSLVAAAGHHLPARELADLHAPLLSDVLVCSDHRPATDATMALMALIPGMRPLDAGGLASAAAIESFTAVLITLNMRYKSHSTLALSGLDDSRVPARTPLPSP